MIFHYRILVELFVRLCVYIYIYIYTYIERGRERGREREREIHDSIYIIRSRAASGPRLRGQCRAPRIVGQGIGSAQVRAYDDRAVLKHRIPYGRAYALSSYALSCVALKERGLRTKPGFLEPC